MSTGFLVLFIGVALALSAIALALGGGSNSKSKVRKRAASLSSGKAKRASRGKGPASANSLKRNQGRSWTAAEGLAKRYLPRQSALRNRLERTGKNITIGTYALISVGLGAVVCVGAWLFGGLSPILASLAGFFAGIAIPHMAIGFMGARRKKKFIGILPDAIDLIVRGLKSGLPVTESIAAVGAEMADPVGTEFRRITDSVRFGQQLETAVWNTAKRMDTPEFNFFVISMSIQRETGGNLAEALQNLSDILRGRRQMRLKVKAMSSEAKASAYILGALPFIMFGLVYAVNPGYALQLFSDTRGLMMVAAGLTSLLIGVAVMAKMVRFEV